MQYRSIELEIIFGYLVQYAVMQRLPDS